jgi:hypothetical protein
MSGVEWMRSGLKGCRIVYGKTPRGRRNGQIVERAWFEPAIDDAAGCVPDGAD